MCLAIPMKVEKISGEFAWVKNAGLTRQVNIQMVPQVKVDDYLIVHAGFAIAIVNQAEARKTLSLIAKIK